MWYVVRLSIALTLGSSPCFSFLACHPLRLADFLQIRVKIMSDPICLVVSVEIMEDRIDDFLKAIEADAIGSRKESENGGGCLRFDVLRDQEQSNKFVSEV